ncbi:hypothetical protein [Corynebacterium propinquum]|uniref:DUF1311 domain-containing protein n=1 Tax=Corynebacterium propinquum TaxID=43769 RepID=A0AAP4FAY8_9CORY|nr:hypothetical protein [Corynebacterium propinquum]MDK4325976.1 hypothetical protein [Corynebacterium propinquum]MDK8534991.1 hypothetical protein [Corynebacterium propinquum]WKS27836.1 hypothetical protein NLL49_00780 [Corynebacterium propinquum]
MIVAIISLVGSIMVAGAALWTNASSNRAADQRRKDDQAAADERRRADQATEDDRRKADDNRRERERREQLQREDYAHQRRAVTEYIRKMRAAEAERRAGPEDLEKYQQLFERYKDYLKDLELEVTHPEVCKCLEEWLERIDEAAKRLRKFRANFGGKGLPSEDITYVIEECPEDLQRSAKEHLHIPYDYNQLK